MGLQGNLDNNSPFPTRVFRLLLKSLSNHLQLFVFFLDFFFLIFLLIKQLYLKYSQFLKSEYQDHQHRLGFFSKKSFIDFLHIG